MGEFINALVSFLLIGAAVYFFIVLPVNKLMAPVAARRSAAGPDVSDVPIAATRCAFCTHPITEPTRTLAAE